MLSVTGGKSLQSSSVMKLIWFLTVAMYFSFAIQLSDNIVKLLCIMCDHVFFFFQKLTREVGLSQFILRIVFHGLTHTHANRDSQGEEKIEICYIVNNVCCTYFCAVQWHEHRHQCTFPSVDERNGIVVKDTNVKQDVCFSQMFWSIYIVPNVQDNKAFF